MRSSQEICSLPTASPRRAVGLRPSGIFAHRTGPCTTVGLLDLVAVPALGAGLRRPDSDYG